MEAERSVKDAQIARSPENVYLRGKTYWGRIQVDHREFRKSLRTTERKLALERAEAWREELWADQWYGRAPSAKVKQRFAKPGAPHKREAHKAVQEALRDGRLKRQPCEVCQSRKTDAHHDDYSKPLEVRWLCPTHHRAHHRAQEDPTP